MRGGEAGRVTAFDHRCRDYTTGVIALDLIARADAAGAERGSHHED
jgi:hypothetical protein